MTEATGSDYTGEAEDEDDGPPPFAAGIEIAPSYRVVALLRRGNDLDVYDVWSDERACSCVAKTLRPDRLTKAAAIARLRREGRLLQRLTHPHIVRAYETIAAPRPIVVLETLGGETLGHLIERREKRLAVAEIAYLGLHLCSAMHYLHGHQIIHLDLKPSNIIASTGIAKVLDLSVARPPGKVRGGIGSFGYMSPEQNHGGLVTPKSDVWGIGAVLFAAATGEAPFDHDETSTSEPQADVPFAPLRRLRRVPRDFAALVDSCLEIDPDRRPTIPELTAAVTDIVAAHGKA